VVEPEAEADAVAEANEAPPVTETCTEALSCCSFMTVIVYTQLSALPVEIERGQDCLTF
jgi:hypothetical protein